MVTKKVLDIAKKLSRSQSEWGVKAPAKGQACMHSKLFVLVYQPCVRVVVMSGNMCRRDWDSNTNSIFVQDFPRADTSDPPSPFKTALVSLSAALGASRLLPHLRKFDFSSAKVTLVTSTPGGRLAPNGQIGLREAVRTVCPLPEKSWRFVSVTSVGGASTTQKLMPTLVDSMHGADAPPRRLKGTQEAMTVDSKLLHIMWPSIPTVLASLNGGSDFFMDAARRAALVDAGVAVLCVSTPPPGAFFAARAGSLTHGKFFGSVSGEATPVIDYLLTGSHNCSAAALGALAQDGGAPTSNFEVSVVFTPGLYAEAMRLETALLRRGRLPASRFTADARWGDANAEVRFVASYQHIQQAGSGFCGHTVRMPIPFLLPAAGGAGPPRYAPTGIPQPFLT